MIIQPAKVRFQGLAGATERFAEMASSETFQSACDAALIHMVENMPHATESAQAMANGFRVEGAKMFLKSLQSMGEYADKPKKLSAIGQLNHKA